MYIDKIFEYSGTRIKNLVTVGMSLVHLPFLVIYIL